jgi:hypothetical protein
LHHQHGQQHGNTKTAEAGAVMDMSEVTHQDLFPAEEDAAHARVRAALEELKQGKGKRYKSPAYLLKALDKLGDE